MTPLVRIALAHQRGLVRGNLTWNVVQRRLRYARLIVRDAAYRERQQGWHDAMKRANRLRKLAKRLLADRRAA